MVRVMKPETRQFVKEYEQYRNPPKQKTVEDLAREIKQDQLKFHKNEIRRLMKDGNKPISFDKRKGKI